MCFSSVFLFADSFRQSSAFKDALDEMNDVATSTVLSKSCFNYITKYTDLERRVVDESALFRKYPDIESWWRLVFSARYSRTTQTASNVFYLRHNFLPRQFRSTLYWAVITAAKRPAETKPRHSDNCWRNIVVQYMAQRSIVHVE